MISKYTRLFQRFSSLQMAQASQQTPVNPSQMEDIAPPTIPELKKEEPIAPVSYKTLKMDFGNIAYEKINVSSNKKDSKKPIIIFLHDVLGSMPQWKDFPHKLCQQTGLEGLIFDRLGYGNSDPINLYEKDAKYGQNYLRLHGQSYIPQIVQEIYKKQINPYSTQEEEDIQEEQKFIIYGHSDGATIALLTAAFLPFRFQLAGLITEAPHVYVDEQTTKGLIDAQKEFEENDYIEKLEKYQGGRAQMLYDFWQKTWLDADYQKNWNILPDIQNEISCPHLIIHGEKDQFAGINQMYDIFNANFNTQLEVLKDCKHFPHKEQQEKVLKMTAQFIKNQVQ